MIRIIVEVFTVWDVKGVLLDITCDKVDFIKISQGVVG